MFHALIRNNLILYHKLVLNLLSLSYIIGEYHGNNPEMSKLLHKAVRQKSESAYTVYQQHLANRPVNVRYSNIILK